MRSATLLDSVKESINETVGIAPLPVSFRSLLMLPLQQPGKILAPDSTTLSVWTRTVLGACEAAGGDLDLGIKAAAAVEFGMASLDLLDEIEDGDQSATVTAVGQPQALNIATALLLLCQQALLDLQRALGPTGPSGAAIFTDAMLKATGGQQRDLCSEQAAELSLDDALAIAREKAGSLVGGAARFGASIGTDRQELLDLYEEWGQHFGTLSQLANDLHDARDDTGKSDIERRKGTLPLIFARRSHAAHSGTTTTDQLLIHGALQFTWVIFEIEHQACVHLIERLAAQGQVIDSLRAML